TGKSAAGATKRLAQGASDDVDLAHDTAIFVCPSSSLTEKSSCVRVVNHGERIIFFCELNNRLEISNGSVHRETAIRSDQPEARVLSSAKLRFKIGHIVVLVTKALRIAEPDAIDDAGVI